MASFSCLKQCEADNVSVKYDFIQDREGLYACLTDCNIMLRTLEMRQPKKPLPKEDGFYKATGVGLGLVFLFFIFFVLKNKKQSRKFKMPVRPQPVIAKWPRREFEAAKQDAERAQLIEKLCCYGKKG